MSLLLILSSCFLFFCFVRVDNRGHSSKNPHRNIQHFEIAFTRLRHSTILHKTSPISSNKPNSISLNRSGRIRSFGNHRSIAPPDRVLIFPCPTDPSINRKHGYLSRFSPQAQRHWRQAGFLPQEEVRRIYQLSVDFVVFLWKREKKAV